MGKKLFLLESLALLGVGGFALATLWVVYDFHIFAPYPVSVLPFIMPMLVGFAVGVSRRKFKMNLIIAFLIPVFSTFFYFLIYTMDLPRIYFQGIAFPPDPGAHFISHFIGDVLFILIGGIIGGFLSGE